jgi:ATP dependent DNA ligase domain
MLYAFDLLELDGEDLRGLSLADRKKRLARLLGRRRIGIVLSDHTAEDGALLFMHACRMGLEGIVSKKLSAPYRSGPSRDWIKVKNPDSPAMIRAWFPPTYETSVCSRFRAPLSPSSPAQSSARAARRRRRAGLLVRSTIVAPVVRPHRAGECS